MPFLRALTSSPIPVAAPLPSVTLTLLPGNIGGRRRSARGFSMVELLIIIVMIGVMALMALPRVRVDRAHVDGAVRTLSMAIMVAQREAVSRGHNVLVVIDTTNHVIRTVWDANNNKMIDAGEKTRPLPYPERVVLGRASAVPAFNGASATVPSMTSVSGMPAIILQRSGSADRSLVLYLTTMRARSGYGENDCRALKLERATGRPNWYTYSRSGWKRI